MNSKESQTSKLHVLILKFADKFVLRRGGNEITSSNRSIYYTWKNINSSQNNNKFKISVLTWNEFELHDGSRSVSDIYHGQNFDNPSVKIYVNKRENKITFKVKNGYSLKLLKPEIMKLLGSTKNKRTADRNGENILHVEITEVVLVYCNIVNNDYQQDSIVLYTFVPNKPLDSLLEISPTNHILLKTFNSEYNESMVY